MKSVTIVYKEKPDLLEIRDATSSFAPENILIQVFCGRSDHETISRIHGELREVFPGTAMIGTSSGGEIINAEIVQNEIVISFSFFEQIKVKSCLIEQNDDLPAAGKKMGSALRKDNPGAVIAFGCGLKGGQFFDISPFLKALSEEIGQVPIAGGQAAGYRESESRIFVFSEQGLTENGFAAASLSGANLCIANAFNLSWVPIGKKMTITRAEGRRVHSIDRKTVKEIYEHYLGIESRPSSLYLVNYFPLMIRRSGMLVTNLIAGVNPDGSFDFMQPFHTGEEVRFGFCDAALHEEGALKLKQTLLGYQPEAVFVYSCEFRKNVLGEDITVDMVALEGCPNSAGFFTFGEYYTDAAKGPCFFQQTMTVLAISEADACPVALADTPAKSRHETDLRRFRLMKVLSHLVGSTTRELEAKNRELAALADKDGLTGLANRRLFDETLPQKIKNHNRSGAPFSIILLDVDFFKQFNDRYGHVAGDDCLRAIARVLRREVKRPSDMAFRYGGEEFGCILSFTGHKGALAVAERIRTGIEMLKIPHEASDAWGHVTVSLGVLTLHCSRETLPHEIIRACDELLYEAKQKGRNCVVGKDLIEK